MLQAAASECDWLFLWLDCDREGENICFEVLDVCREAGHFMDESRVLRAKFSALSDAEVTSCDNGQ